MLCFENGRFRSREKALKKINSQVNQIEAIESAGTLLCAGNYKQHGERTQFFVSAGEDDVGNEEA